MASRAEYGSNPNAGRNPNAQNGWGPWQWPIGVPGSMLAIVTVPGNVKIIIRKELAELVGLMYAIAKVKYGRDFSRGWTGGYMNRAIAGTYSPSNHSKGKAIDNDAAENPMSSTFRSNIPPGLVHDWESLGWYWGGRYSGKYDTMHFEYCYSPADVPRHVALAKTILARAGGTVIEQGQPPAPQVATGLGSHGEWPLPPGHYFGSVDGPAESHSGDDRYDNQYVRNYIAEWQHQLNQLGYGAGTTDGVWGAKTAAATVAWQRNNGMLQSSAVGLNDWEAIHGTKRVPAAGAVAPPAGISYPGPTERGATGAVVKTIQDRLVGIGHMTAAQRASGPGTYGPQTEAAVKRAQRAAGLNDDGIVGPKTWAALFGNA